MKVGNNQLCPCESGKKFKKCCKNKKQRTTVIDGYFDQPTTLNNVRFDIFDGSFGCYLNDDQQDISRSISTLSYGGDNRQKILSRISGKAGNTQGYVDANLLQFKHVVAIDTNTKMIGSDKVCVVVAIVFAISKYAERMRLRSTNILRIEFWNPVKSPERIGWRLSMEAIMELEEYKKVQNFGIIVDSELGNIDSFNTRESEILQGFTLPDQMTMIYGSSDKKNDSAINTAIFSADKISNLIHDKIKSNNYIKSGVCISNDFSDLQYWSEDKPIPWDAPTVLTV